MIYILNDLKWKPIVGFKNVKDGVYEVSNYGDVRFIKDKSYPNTKIANKKRHPYIAVYLEKTHGKKEWVLVHQLVARFFLKVPKKYKGMNIDDLVPDHLNNVGTNNYYRNLELKTRGENTSDAFKMKFIDYSGEKHRDSFISNKEAKKICELIEAGKTKDQIIKAMGFPNNDKYRTLISRIKHGTSFKDISKKYDFKDKVFYTKEQQYILDNLPKILQMIDSGKTNSEIFFALWKDKKKDKYLSKTDTIRKIRKRKIYKSEIEEYYSNMSND